MVSRYTASLKATTVCRTPVSQVSRASGPASTTASAASKRMRPSRTLRLKGPGAACSSSYLPDVLWPLLRQALRTGGKRVAPGPRREQLQRECAKTNQREDSVDSGPNPSETNEASHKQQPEKNAHEAQDQRRQEAEERLERRQIRHEEREDREQVRQEEREEREQIRQEEREDRKRERQKARGQEESSS
jgi:hypothetical protein